MDDSGALPRETRHSGDVVGREAGDRGTGVTTLQGGVGCGKVFGFFSGGVIYIIYKVEKWGFVGVFGVWW